MKIEKQTIIKIAGIAGTMMSIGATLLNSYSNKKEQEEIIDKKLREALESQDRYLIGSKEV